LKILQSFSKQTTTHKLTQSDKTSYNFIDQPKLYSAFNNCMIWSQYSMCHKQYCMWGSPRRSYFPRYDL